MSACDPLRTLGITVQDGAKLEANGVGYFSELKGYHAALGPVRFWCLLLGTVSFSLLLAGADIWLSDKIGWPEAYGFQCHGRGCWLQNWIHSPKLLRGGSPYELGLFALLWWMPAVVGGCLVYALVKRRRRNRAHPMD